MFRPRVGIALFLIPLVAFSLACTSPVPTPTLTATPRPPTPTPIPEPPVTVVSAGVGTGPIIGAAFAPQNITIPVGTTVTWTNVPDAGHSVTFFVEGAPRPSGSARTWAATVKPGETAVWDGTALIHSGVMRKDQKISITFPKEGTHNYFCPIHVTMEGTVSVVSKGQPYTTASQATATAKQEIDAMLSLVEPNRAAAVRRATKTVQPDGSTLWTIPVGPLVYAPNGYFELTEYFPAELKVKRGDTVRWLYESGHSVTFLPPGTTLPRPAPPATKPSPEYDGKGLYTSGVLSPGASGLGLFELRFATAGTFPYLCQLHGPDLGHEGTVIVE